MRVFSKAALLAAPFVLAAGVPASAQNSPFTPGDYEEVAMIEVADGHGLDYANYLATTWRKNQEFAKSKGWIKDYKIFANTHPRSGEADLYLIRVMESVVSGPEGEKRAQEYREWSEKSMEQMQTESGNRAEYREVLSSSLLQELLFRD